MVSTVVKMAGQLKNIDVQMDILLKDLRFSDTKRIALGPRGGFNRNGTLSIGIWIIWFADSSPVRSDAYVLHIHVRDDDMCVAMLVHFQAYMCMCVYTCKKNIYIAIWFSFQNLT